MYNFRDVNNASEIAVLPSEALSINGIFIENEIVGYRTLNVTGREALSPEIETFITGVRDGSTFKSKRYPARKIKVKYQLITSTNEEFRNAFNKLAALLNFENAELIFNDETDKFFIGTTSEIGEVEPGKNAVIGDFTILCNDPFKYSVEEYEAEPLLDENSILIDYKGTYKSFPILEADFYSEDEVSEDGETNNALTGSGDCGYVAFFNEREKIIQMGDPEETDTETYPKSQTLISQSFKKTSAWGVAARDLWVQNEGITTGVSKLGSMGIKAASYKDGENPATSGTLLKNAKSTQSAPTFYYNVTAKASERTATTAKVEITISASLGRSESYFGNGLGLIGSVYIGGSWHDITLKKESAYWKGKSAHVVSKTYTVSGLSSTQTSITGIKFKVKRSDSNGDAGKLGETKCNDLKICAYSTPTVSSYYLSAADYKTASGVYHGPSITRSIPADAAGDTGAANFTFTYTNKICIGNDKNATNQIGSFRAFVISTSGEILAGINIFKGSAGKKGKLRFYVNGKTKSTIDVDLSFNNKRFTKNKSSTITKSGKKITFNICGIKKTFTDSSISNVKAAKISFDFFQFGSKPALRFNGINFVKFVKNKCDTWEDIPNKFSANDIVEADCNSGEIYLNGIIEPAYGALGNDWEEFYLTPGLNQIGFTYSDWVEDAYAPTFKVRYREVYL